MPIGIVKHAPQAQKSRNNINNTDFRNKGPQNVACDSGMNFYLEMNQDYRT